MRSMCIQIGHFLFQNQFQQEFLDPPNTMFKTTNIGSFIRQLNLYGFRKLNVVRFAETTPDVREVHEFQNDFFHRGRPDLLAYLKRNVGIRRTRDLAVKRRLETMESGSAAKHPRYAPQVYLNFDQEGCVPGDIICNIMISNKYYE